MNSTAKRLWQSRPTTDTIESEALVSATTVTNLTTFTVLRGGCCCLHDQTESARNFVLAHVRATRDEFEQAAKCKLYYLHSVGLESWSLQKALAHVAWRTRIRGTKSLRRTGITCIILISHPQRYPDSTNYNKIL